MSDRIKALIIVCIIVVFGMTARAFTFQNSHPDGDELFELKKMQMLSLPDVLKQDTFYGDHTSYPGEFLMHYLPMKALGLFEKPAQIDIEHGKLSGISKNGFWVLAIPKILLTVLSVVLFYLICIQMLNTTLAITIAFVLFMFNGHLIYHAFSLRPYGILPELAIINLFFASRAGWGNWHTSLHRWTYATVIFFTCIYHAYGPLIAFLPLWFFRKTRPAEVLWACLAGTCMWIYYAAYNHMGMTPNKVQSVVDSFQFIHKESFLTSIADSIFGGNVLTLAIVPFVLIGLQYLDKRLLVFGILMIVLPMALIMAIDIKTQYWIHPRQWTWVIPAIALWCGMITEASFKERADVAHTQTQRPS